MIYHNHKKSFRASFEEVHCKICHSSLGYKSSSFFGSNIICEKCELKHKRLEKLKKINNEN